MAPKSKSKTAPIAMAPKEAAPVAKKGRKAADPPPEAPPAKKGRASKKDESKEDPPKAKSAMELFQEEIQTKENAMGKKALILGTIAEDNESEEDEDGEDDEGEEEEDEDALYEKEATIEELRALPVIYLSEDQMKIVDACTEEMSLIGRDGPDDPFRMTNTSDAADAIALIGRTEKKATKALKSSPSTAFAYNLGLTMIAIADDFWLYDNDDPASCNKVLKLIRALWTKLLKLKPSELGITAEEVGTVKKLIDTCVRCVKEIGEGISGDENLYVF